MLLTQTACILLWSSLVASEYIIQIGTGDPTSLTPIFQNQSSVDFVGGCFGSTATKLLSGGLDVLDWSFQITANGTGPVPNGGYHVLKTIRTYDISITRVVDQYSPIVFTHIVNPEPLTLGLVWVNVTHYGMYNRTLYLPGVFYVFEGAYITAQVHFAGDIGGHPLERLTLSAQQLQMSVLEGLTQYGTIVAQFGWNIVHSVGFSYQNCPSGY